jgi:hypothetical protein
MASRLIHDRPSYTFLPSTGRTARGLPQFPEALTKSLKQTASTTWGKVLAKTLTWETCMLRPLRLGTLVCASSLLSISWAQNKIESTQTGPPFPFAATVYQWDYSCPNGISCSFICPGGEAGHVIKLSLFLGTVPFEGGQSARAVFYEYTTREFPHASGFGISGGLNTLTCQISGMTLDYSGSPK